MMQNLENELKRAAYAGEHLAALDLASRLWSGGRTHEWIVVAAYRAARSLDDNKRAASWVEKGIERFPRDWRFMRFRGDLLSETGDSAPAVAAYERAFALDRSQPSVAGALGGLLLKLGRYEQAATSLRAAVNLSLENAHPTWLSKLGMAEMKLGNFHEALAATLRANELRPDPSLEWRISELRRRMASGNVSLEAAAEYYDDVFANRDEYQTHWRDSGYAAIWVKIVDELRQRHVTAILDLGCGPGQFAQAVYECLPGVRYHGVDFSSIAIERAKAAVPTFDFSRATLPKGSYTEFGKFDTVVCTEVLEHVENELPIIEAIPPGVLVVFSVPNFDSFGHVRVYPSADNVSERYSSHFANLEIKPQALGRGNVLWLGIGTKSAI